MLWGEDASVWSLQRSDGGAVGVQLQARQATILDDSDVPWYQTLVLDTIARLAAQRRGLSNFNAAYLMGFGLQCRPPLWARRAASSPQRRIAYLPTRVLRHPSDLMRNVVEIVV